MAIRDSEQRPFPVATRIFGGAVLALVVLVGIILANRPADAQQVCLVRGDVIERLTMQHQEEVVGRGLTENGKAMFEVFAGDKDTWTIIVTDINGRSCLIGGGQSWTEIEALPGQST